MAHARAARLHDESETRQRQRREWSAPAVARVAPPRVRPDDLERVLVSSPVEAEFLWFQLALGLESG